MFDEKQIKGNISTLERQLLYDIRELLKEQNELLRGQNRPVINDSKAKDKLKAWEKPCPFCGVVHNNQGKYLACAKKHKKEGVNK